MTDRELLEPLPENAELRKGLENCRLYAARHRKEEWAKTILRFCEESGVKGSPLRAAMEGEEVSPELQQYSREQIAKQMAAFYRAFGRKK